MSDRPFRRPWLRLAVAFVIFFILFGVAIFSPLRETWQGWLAGTARAAATDEHDNGSVELLTLRGNQGLRLSDDAVSGLGVYVEKVTLATKERPLPPIIGTVNYDNDHLFTIRSRFPGELADVRRILDTDNPITPTRERPLRFGDKVKQGEVLAVVWSQPLGAAKAALVDAISAVRLSKDTLERYNQLYREGAINHTSVKAGERQLEADANTLLTAERSLRMWKMDDKEIADIKAEANMLLDQKKKRSADNEARWARVEICAPWFDKAHPDRDLVVVEKNTNMNDMVDPIASAPLFKLADTSRLEIWAHPPEELLPLIREGIQKKGSARLKWDVRFQSDAPDLPARLLDIVQIAPSIEAVQHTPMILGYLPNPGGQFAIGQFVTATIFTPPDPDTVEVPTMALNEVDGQSLVFVQSDSSKRDFELRRVSVVRRFKNVSYARSKLTDEDRKNSHAEVKRGRRPLQPLMPGEIVAVHGIVEMTAALKDLALKARIAAESKR